jgi:hypothetical protein
MGMTSTIKSWAQYGVVVVHLLVAQAAQAQFNYLTQARASPLAAF